MMRIASSTMFLIVLAIFPGGASEADPAEIGLDSTHWYAAGNLSCRLQGCGKTVGPAAGYLSFGPGPGLDEGEFDLSIFNRDFSISTKGTFAGSRGKRRCSRWTRRSSRPPCGSSSASRS